jgi:uncharacterized protein YyaL (SSP411 family)
VIAGKTDSEDTEKMLTAIQKIYAPGKVLLFRPDESGSPEITKLAPFTEFQKSIDGKATVYVCEDYACKAPTTDIQKAIEDLAGERR